MRASLAVWPHSIATGSTCIAVSRQSSAASSPRSRPIAFATIRMAGSSRLIGKACTDMKRMTRNDSRQPTARKGNRRLRIPHQYATRICCWSASSTESEAFFTPLIAASPQLRLPLRCKSAPAPLRANDGPDRQQGSREVKPDLLRPWINRSRQQNAGGCQVRESPIRRGLTGPVSGSPESRTSEAVGMSGTGRAGSRKWQPAAITPCRRDQRGHHRGHRN